ncbi:flagellar basal body-associated FliL family protein [Sphingomonas nostoxanthinifaciens]|uniref:flagellar basal body-associated FliL family protein n=1 Tax=Sphingomonas nostoxanthinifaciens TaxID=2872652 RepID=UPI001CC1C27D|nr:flagellar basal body-associated FliL family protein [Sphingomonas nostoxanthinifaciens]UAK26029.1 flagellar basal body-associated FliL family protein [Sphingomonas nostoxanthinifaciens]
MSDDKKADSAPKKKGGLIKKLVMFAVLPLVLIGGGIGAGVFAAGKGLVGGGDKAKTHRHVDPNAPKLVLKEGEDAPIDLPETVKVDPEVYKSSYYTVEQPFTSNLSDTEGFLQLGIGVSTYYDAKVIDHLKDSEMPVRSAVLEVLAQQTADKLNTPEGKLALRRQLKGVINGVLREREGFGGIDDVYFTSFIIQ